MARIVIDARLINSSTGTYTRELIRNLEMIDTNNQYIIVVPEKDIDYYVPKNSRFTITTCDASAYSFKEQTAMLSLLRSLSPDLVHFCMPQQPVLYRGKSVTTFHDLSLLRVYNSDKNWLSYHLKQLIGHFVFRVVARKTNRIITPTDFVKHDVARTLGVSAVKIIRTYEAANKPLDELQPYSVPFEKFILYVGQQSDYKNIKGLAAAHQTLLPTYPDLGLVLVGKLSGPATINQKYFEKLGYKNIHFTDFLSDSKRNWLYKNTLAYIFPSLTEGFGLPGLEAMSYGAPVLSSDATCLPEVYGDAAHYFDPKSSVNMARAINDVLSDEKLRLKLVANGYKQVKKYSWEQMARETHQIYLDVLAVEN